MAGLPAVTSGAGWLSSSGSIDHGRFEPGAVVDGRYRVIGLLGRGGMGEVYRADDLRLGQPVAIKLLPEALAGDPQRLVQFHNEVRTARQVSHPNVCRVYDIGDLVTTTEGVTRHQLYLPMEYVDGEDLSSLLRRIGRLPEDKAVEIARQICAGLGAAHARGVIHRDLKPANIMLDSAGQARLMDFGLASAGAGLDVRAGTPAYMAPEQLGGAPASVQSDIFALGLVLYELFTGRRGFQARTLGELVELHQTGTIVPPSALVTGLNPVIERVILRCLALDPAARPQSVTSVAAALPGGDPLAAALAAGETPSPQMVAAAGDQSAPLSLRVATLWLVAAVLLLGSAAWLSHRLSLYAPVTFARAPETLADRARDIATLAGMPAADVVDQASGFLALTSSGPSPALVFWHRASPQWLVPNGVRVSPEDPPALASGHTSVILDLSGRLLSFERLPPPVAAAPTQSVIVDWAPFFEAADLDPTTLTAASPTYSPRAFADRREAWIGTWPGLPGATLRVEAGSLAGVPVYFRTFGPWNLPDAPAIGNRAVSAVAVVALLVGPLLMVAAALVARANVRAGRGDRLGARRLAGGACAVLVGSWLFSAHHVGDVGLEQQRLFAGIARALFDAAVLWIFYLAAEPYVRRTWPHILIGWSRLLSGGLRDARVGRDLLLGVACGVAMTVLSYVFHLMPGLLGWPPIQPHAPDLYLGTRALLGQLLAAGSSALSNAMLGVLGLALLRAGLHRLWPAAPTTALAFGIATLLFTPLAARGQFQSGHLTLDLTFGLLLVLIILGVIFRLGLLAGFVGFCAHFWTWGIVTTVDGSKPYFDTGLVTLTIVAAAAIAGFVLVQRREQAV